jgi:hypothetical protein
MRSHQKRPLADLASLTRRHPIFIFPKGFPLPSIKTFLVFFIISMMSGLSGAILALGENHTSTQIFLTTMVLSTVAWVLIAGLVRLYRRIALQDLPLFALGWLSAFATIASLGVATFGMTSELFLASLLMVGTGLVVGSIEGIRNRLTLYR